MSNINVTEKEVTVPIKRERNSPMRLTRKVSNPSIRTAADSNISPIHSEKSTSPLSPSMKKTFQSNNKPFGLSGSTSFARKSISSAPSINLVQTTIPSKRKSSQGIFTTNINTSLGSSNNINNKFKNAPSAAGRVSLSPLTPTEALPSKSNSLAPTVPKTSAASRSRPSISRSTSKMKIESEKTVAPPTQNTSIPRCDNRNDMSFQEMSSSTRIDVPDSPSVECEDKMATYSVDSTYICYDGYGGTFDSTDEQQHSHCDPNDIFLDCDLLSNEEGGGKKKHIYHTNPLHAGNSRLSVSSAASQASNGLVNIAENKATPNLISVELQAALNDAENMRKEVAALKSNLNKKELQLSQCTLMLKNSFLRQAEVEDRAGMLVEELHMFKFLSSIQEQKVNELEQAMSAYRMEHNESMSSKSRKHKAIVKKLTSERSEHEARTNAMINQLNEQMSLLQKMAMERMEVLEKELMMERHKAAQKIESLERNISTDKIKYSRLLTENNALKAAAATSAAQKLTPRGMKSSRPLREIDLKSISRSYSNSSSKSFCESTSGSTISSKSKSWESRDSVSSATEPTTAKKKRLLREKRISDIGGNQSRLSLDSSIHSCDSDCSNATERRSTGGDQEDEEVSDEVEEEVVEEVEEQLEDENVAALESSEVSDDIENRVTDGTTSACEANSELDLLENAEDSFVPSTLKEKERARGGTLPKPVPTAPIMKNWSI